MKKKILIPIIALGAIFAGCSSDKSSDPVANDVVDEATLQPPQAAKTDVAAEPDDEFVEDEYERTDGCSIGLNMTTEADLANDEVFNIEIVAEKICGPDSEPEILTDIYGDLSYSLLTRKGEVVVESLPVGSVYYGCIDLTDESNPKIIRNGCTGIAPGTYRLNVMYEGKSTYFKFRVQGEIEE
jgi:hypothetical protein